MSIPNFRWMHTSKERRLTVSTSEPSPVPKQQTLFSHFVGHRRTSQEGAQKRRRKRRAVAAPAGEMAAPPKAWKAEYAKSGRSSCKSCRSPIGKDQLRLGKMVQATQFDGFMPVRNISLHPSPLAPPRILLCPIDESFFDLWGVWQGRVLVRLRVLGGFVGRGLEVHLKQSKLGELWRSG